MSRGWVHVQLGRLLLRGPYHDGLVGRRLYLEYTMDDTEEGRSEDLSVTPLAEGQAYPDLDESAGVYWYRPDHINEHLGLAGPRSDGPQRLN